MQSDDEDFEETLETLTPDRKIQTPGSRFPLRRTPARIESPTAQRKMDQQKLFEDLCTGSAATAQNPSAAGFAFGNMQSTSNATANHLQLRKTTRRKKRQIDYRR